MSALTSSAKQKLHTFEYLSDIPTLLVPYHFLHTGAFLHDRNNSLTFRNRRLRTFSWCSLQRTVDCHRSNMIFRVRSSFISCALTYPLLLYVSSVFPFIHCYFFSLVLHRSLFLTPFFLCWLLLAAAGCGCLWACPALLFLCASHSYNLWYPLPSLPLCKDLSFLIHSTSCCPFLCSSSANYPSWGQGVCARASSLQLLLVVSTTFAGSDHNPSCISKYPCFSARTFQILSLDHEIIMFFTKSGHVSFTLLTSYLGHSSICNLTELPDPLHCPEQTLLTIVLPHLSITSPCDLPPTTFLPTPPHCSWPAHVSNSMLISRKNKANDVVSLLPSTLASSIYLTLYLSFAAKATA